MAQNLRCKVFNSTSATAAFIAFCLLYLTPCMSEARTELRLGLDSNMLVLEDRLIFAQADGSLTAIDIKSGKVLLRKLPEDGLPYSGELLKRPSGVLMIDYKKVSLLDENRDFIAVWSADDAYSAVASEHFLLSHDGNRTLECREISSGKTIWSTDFKGGCRLQTVGDIASVATLKDFQGPHSLRVFRMSTGEQLGYLKQRTKEVFLNTFLAEDSIFLVAAIAGSASRGLGRRSLLEIDFECNEIQKINLPSDKVISRHGYQNPLFGFFFDGNFFDYDGHVRKITSRENPEELSKFDESYEEVYVTESGVFASQQLSDITGNSGVVIDFHQNGTKRRFYVPYIHPDGVLDRLIESHGKFIFSSLDGFVECVDIESGRSEWLYLFPTTSKALSMSRNYFPANNRHQRDVAAYKDRLSRIRKTTGSIEVLPTTWLDESTFESLDRGVSYGGRILIDPSSEFILRQQEYSSRFLLYSIIACILITIGMAYLIIRCCCHRNLNFRS